MNHEKPLPGKLSYGLNIRKAKEGLLAKRSINVLDTSEAKEGPSDGLSANVASDSSTKHYSTSHCDQAIAEDATIFLYDEHVEERDKLRERFRAKGVESIKKPKYMDALLSRAADRKEQQERAKVRIMQREAQDEATKFQDKEVFVTAAYKAKLASMKGGLEKDKHNIEREKVVNSDSQRDLSKFYGNLMTRNVAFGQGHGRIFTERAPDREMLKNAAVMKAAAQRNDESSDEELPGPKRKS